MGLSSEDFFVRGSWGFVVYKVWEARGVQENYAIYSYKGRRNSVIFFRFAHLDNVRLDPILDMESHPA